MTDPVAISGVAKAPPCTLVIFGAEGDLTHRLLMPALYNLATLSRLDDGFQVLGIDRTQASTEDWANDLTATLEGFTQDHTAEFHPDTIDAAAWGFVRQRLTYTQGDFSDPALFQTLARRLTGNALFYLAVPARLFGPLVTSLGAAGLLAEADGRFRRVLIEKPFGCDLPSAEALNAQCLAAATEDQIFRIDHFMGKEAAQNLLPFRAATPVFEALWHRDAIDHVEITAAETVGVEARGAFYEQTGALRDMVPNHLFTLLSMLAMDLPDTLTADAVRDAKSRLLGAIAPIAPADCVRGQYETGTVLGKPARAYRAEPGVAADSDTETYVALKLGIDTWRWQGVPFYIRTGKHLAARRTEMIVHFRSPARALFGEARAPTVLGLEIDPEPGGWLAIGQKAPGLGLRLASGEMRFQLDGPGPHASRDGYEGIFHGAMCGDRLLFQRADAIEAGWAAVQPILTAPPPLAVYPSGTAGPDEAASLLARQGHAWRPLA